MTAYTKSTNFASKDSLASGNPLKIVKGTEIDTEFNNIATAVATKADVASPTFTGVPAAPTASAGTSTTQVATTAFVTAANALQDTAMALKAPLASPALTGTPTAPTAAVDTTTTQIATTAFVVAQAATVAPLANGVAAVGTSKKYARQDHVHSLAIPFASSAVVANVAATNYTNGATTKMVVIYVGAAGGLPESRLTATVAGVAGNFTESVNYNGAWVSESTLVFMVPPNAVYRVDWSVNTGTIKAWYEAY